METYRLWIDDAACWGCQACEVACKQENDIPVGVKIIRVGEIEPRDLDEKDRYTFTVSLCRQCADAPCADVCPVEAITRRADGVVILDSEECTGCRACMDACPYDAIAFDEASSVAMKCNLCVHRIDKGLVPACADNICPAHCIYFGTEEEIRRATASDG